MNPDDFFKQLDEFGRRRIPCLFLIDFEEKQPLLFPLDGIDPSELLYSFPESTNCPQTSVKINPPPLSASPVRFEAYRKAFGEVREELARGNTYLVNLTFGTPVSSSGELVEFFHAASASYRVWLRDRFVFFSPEQFVSIRENTIRTFPMKGTCDADSPGAKERLLADEKEKAEHVTVVDLLRNDLSMVSRNVRVNRFRFITRVNTTGRQLLQTSSEICGDLVPGWQGSLGTMMNRLLPAGSVSGAPKKKTVQIIRNVESHARGYYTGVAGIFDGESLDSAVMIRFIEKNPDGCLVYKSGGGITIYSDPIAEYQELIDKIYVPV